MKRARFVVRAMGGRTVRGHRREPWFVLDTGGTDAGSLVASYDTRRAADAHAAALNRSAAHHRKGGPMPFVYRLDLTPHQRAALLTVLGEYIARPDAIEVSIDAVGGGDEIEIASLLPLVLNAPVITTP